jgi:CheY-like chemotaxis protein
VGSNARRSLPPDLEESRLRLLIVDDSALMRKVTHLAFPATKFEVEEAENGSGALAQLSLAQHPSDAIGAHGHPWR